MRFRSKRTDDPAKRAEQQLEAVTIGRVREATDGAASVIGALALFEVRHRVQRLAVADLGEGALAEDVQRILAGQRETVFGEGTTLALDGVDGVVAVVPGVLPAEDVLEHVQRFGDLLVGVLVVEADAPVSAQSRPAPAPPPRAAAPPEPDPELQRRLAELSARESALRRITEAVQKGHGDVPPGVAPEELAAMTVRAERAEARVAELEAQLAAVPPPAPPVAAAPPPPPPPPAPAPVAPPPPPPPTPIARGGRPTLAQLEALVNDAYTRGDPAAEEWSVYVPLLREHAEPDGTLPAQFDALIEQVFGRALGR